MIRENREPVDPEPQEASMGSLSRRTLLRRGAAIGFTAATAGSLAAGARAGMRWSTKFDPKKYAGTTISILMTGDENDHRALGDKLGELEHDTGIKVQITAPSLTPLINKTLQNLKAKRSDFELIEYLGFLATQQIGGGYFEKLNPYIANPNETPPGWDFKDFFPAAMRNVGLYNLKTHTLGTGSVYAIPGLHSGSVVYFYRKDLFDKAGLKPARTWGDFMNAAKKLNSSKVAGASFIGASDFSLSTVDWYTRFITMGGKIATGDPTKGNFMPHVNSPQGVKAMQMLIDTLPYAPKHVTSYGFAENVDDFSAGKIAQMIFWSTIAGPVYDPNKSKVADVTGVTLVPANRGFPHSAIQGGWGVGIPKNADPAKKAAAWRALTWMTSKSFNAYEESKYQIDANRSSTFRDPKLVKQLPYLPYAGQAIAKAHIIETSHVPEFFELNTMAYTEFNKALIRKQSAKQAVDNVQKQWLQVCKRAGHLK
jgi:multiple sugar transport system substrate-binding protein